MEKNKEKVYILLPTYNERENLPGIIAAIESLKLPYDWWAYILDDKSPDGTGKIADSLALQGKRVKVMHREKKEGLGSAYKAGFNKALEDGADFVVTMDADFSHDPKYIPELIIAAHDYDLVIGSRYVRGGRLEYPWSRKLLSWFANSSARIILGLKIRDATAGFKCYRVEALRKIGFENFISNGYVFQVESHASAQENGLLIKETPILFTDRKAGETKMNPKEAYQGLWLLFKIGMRERRQRTKI